MGNGRNVLAVAGLAVLLAGGITTCVVVDHLWSGSRQTRRIATPDYVLEQYKWFKNQSSALDQVDAQISSTTAEIDNYKKDFADVPRVNWPFDAREELSRRESVLRGSISHRNMLAKDYNARTSDVTANFAEGEKPKELAPFLRTYEVK